MTILSLETSKKVYELCGEYDTERVFAYDFDGRYTVMFREELEICLGDVPAPNFAELIRLLRKIGEKKGWKQGEFSDAVGVAFSLLMLYMNAPTEPEGMRAVEEYLMKLFYDPRR
ncbi:MAG TPA: hypothetical protein PLI01_00500 [Nitrospira sp.]|nr:hypothetical protein [Nitrospira sp.]HNA25239.1 hypothetical protein [Nitrospira sp.]HNI17529.1 hypothetical protein [Nitrospira sp.]